MAGCGLLFVSLGWYTVKLFLIWAVIGLVVYFIYSRRRSHLAPGNAPVHGGPQLEPAPTFHEGPDPGP